MESSRPAQRCWPVIGTVEFSQKHCSFSWHSLWLYAIFELTFSRSAIRTALQVFAGAGGSRPAASRSPLCTERAENREILASEWVLFPYLTSSNGNNFSWPSSPARANYYCPLAGTATCKCSVYVTYCVGSTTLLLPVHYFVKKFSPLKSAIVFFHSLGRLQLTLPPSTLLPVPVASFVHGAPVTTNK